MSLFHSIAALRSAKMRLAILAGAALVSTSAPAAGQITGAGSTWVYPLIAKWAAAYQAQTGVRVNYQSIGSGGGTIAFGPLPASTVKAVESYWKRNLGI